MTAEPQEAVTVTMSLTARVHDKDGRGGYDLTCENNEVTIVKFGPPNRKPVVLLAEIERAIKALRALPQ
jgi:hypothetical protein